MFLATAAPFILLASTVVANHLSLPLIKRVESTGTGPHPLHGRYNNNPSNGFNFHLGNVTTYYVVNVSIGDPAPPTNHSLLVDTGSPITWVGAGMPYVITNSSFRTNNTLNMTYGYGSDTWSISGTMYTDDLFLGGNATANVSGQAIGVVQGPTALSSFSGVDGLLGLGPTIMTIGDPNTQQVMGLPTLPDNLALQHNFTNDFSVYFEPVNESSIGSGELIFGNYDKSKYHQPLIFLPVSNQSAANHTWSVDVNITYNGSQILGNTYNTTTPCIIDSKSPFIYLPSDAYNRYVNATGATLDSVTNTLRLPSDHYRNLSSLYVLVYSENRTREIPLVLIANAQILPRALTGVIGGTPDNVYLTVKDIGNSSLCVLGIPFLERYYTCFNSTSGFIGFAFTPFTMLDIN